MVLMVHALLFAVVPLSDAAVNSVRHSGSLARMNLPSLTVCQSHHEQSYLSVCAAAIPSTTITL